jgi:hypothetical protein
MPSRIFSDDSLNARDCHLLMRLAGNTKQLAVSMAPLRAVCRQSFKMVPFSPGITAVLGPDPFLLSAARAFLPKETAPAARS